MSSHIEEQWGDYVISEEKLREVFSSNNVIPIRYLNNENCRRPFVLDISLDEFVEFIKIKNVGIVFYKYFFYDFEKYLITEETIDSIDIELDDELKARIEKYNDGIRSYDFDRPCRLTCLIECENSCYSINIEEKWIEEQERINEPEIALISMVNSYGTDDTDEIYNRYLNEQTEKLNVLLAESKRKLVEFLLSDSKFKMCTNQSLRNSYALTLEESNPDLVAAFYNKNGRYEVHRAYSAFEIVYKCMKSGMTDVDEIANYIG